MSSLEVSLHFSVLLNPSNSNPFVSMQKFRCKLDEYPKLRGFPISGFLFTQQPIRNTLCLPKIGAAGLIFFFSQTEPT